MRTITTTNIAATHHASIELANKKKIDLKICKRKEGKIF